MSSGRLRVGLLRNPPDLSSISMEGYADNLHAELAALDKPPDVTELRPPRSSVSDALSRFGLSPRLVRYWRRYPSYMRRVRGLDADVVHVLDHAYGHLAYVLDGIPTVVTCHDIFSVKRHRGEIPALPPQRLPPLTVRFSLAGLRRAAAVITPTEATRDDLVRHVGVDPARIVVVPNGVHRRFRPLDEAELAEGCRRHPAWPSAGPSILTVDTGVARKNQRAMLEVLARVRAVRPATVLIHQGKPFAGPELTRARSLGVADAVVELGRVDDADLAFVFNRADVMLFPSHYEGFGLPPVEAMACGTPIVCSNTRAVHEVTGGRALEADAADYDGLAANVLRILDDDALRARLVQEGLEWARRYTWSALAESALAVYRRVVDEARRPARGRPAHTEEVA